MNVRIGFSHINTSSLDLDDTRFMLSPQDETPDEALVASIREFGLLSPPLVLESEPGQFIIISGRKEIKALLQARTVEKIPCLVLPEKTSAIDIYSFLLEYSLIHSPLSVAEQAVFFEKLTAKCSTEVALPFLQKLGYKANLHTLNELLKIKNLCSSAFACLHEGILKHNNARKMLKLSIEDQKILVGIIRRLNLSGSKQKQFIDLSSELISRRGTCIEEILRDMPSPESEKQQANAPQLATALLKWLYNECYPQLTNEESRFKKRVAQLNLHPHMQVNHTPSFEDDGISLSIHFSDWNGLEQTLTKIKEKE